MAFNNLENPSLVVMILSDGILHSAGMGLQSPKDRSRRENKFQDIGLTIAVS
jgi:hypothetical protein